MKEERGKSLLGITSLLPSHAFDHADIIGPIPDGQCHHLLVPLHQLYHLGLLKGCHPAADYSLAHAGYLQQLQLQVLF